METHGPGAMFKTTLFPVLLSQGCQATGSLTPAIVTKSLPEHQSSSSLAPFPCPAEANQSPVANPHPFLVALAPQGHTQNSRDRVVLWPSAPLP